MNDLRVRLQDVLGTSHVIERELGGGGMSRVFVAEETRFHRRVVLKVLAPEIAAELSTERFAREIAMAAQLQHPNIVAVISAGEVEGLPWYSMPYVEGETLRERMDRGAVPVGEGVAILRDVARALAYAHAHGIVHRDIKPQNVLLSSGVALVADFGIAKAVNVSRTDAAAPTLTQAGMSIGTPAYIAPEQALGEVVDQRADIYSWGVLAYELLSGRHPFADRTSPQQLVAAHLAETPRAVRGGTAELPSAVRDLIMRCLAKQPDARPASAAELLAALGDGSAVGDTGRRRVAMLGAAAGIVLLLGALGWSMHRGGVASASAAEPVMLAVIPFEHAGPVEQSAFTDGLSDAVTAKLAALPELGVIDRRSAAQYRLTAKSARTIGTELGVQYLVEGIVRWAPGTGGWRAQVTPTLVDARTGVTKWTGESVLVTPQDPFTAQGAIAGKVVDALQLALHPKDRAALAHHTSDDPEAYAAYQRGRVLFDEVGRTASTYQADLQRAIGEFRRAVALDSSFVDAWGELASAEYLLSTLGPDTAHVRFREILRQALVHASGHPRVLMAHYLERLREHGDTSGIDALLSEAIREAPNDARVLRQAGLAMAWQQRQDSGFALVNRAVELDPRTPSTLRYAAQLAQGLRRWTKSELYASAMIRLDSADERGWGLLINQHLMMGDTLRCHQLLEAAMRHVPNFGADIRGAMAYTSDADARAYLRLSGRDLHVQSLPDSIQIYFDNKADAALRIHDTVLVRAYYDSIYTLLRGRRLTTDGDLVLLMERALVEAYRGQRDDAQRTVRETLAIASKTGIRPDLTDMLDPMVMGRIYTRLGDPESAVRWLEAGLANPIGMYTVARYKLDATLWLLRGTPAWERFLKAHPN